MIHKRLILLTALICSVFFRLSAQSPCYLVILGTGKKERIRIASPQFHTNGNKNLIGHGYTLFANENNAFTNAQTTKIEIKSSGIGRFRPVQLNIPPQHGCHLLLVRDPNLTYPLYFRTEWISQEMMDEYSFPGSYNSFDTTLFSRNYKTVVALPTVEIYYKGQPFTAELMRSVNPFNGQNLEVKMSIVAANDSQYDAKLKAVEISFIHPHLNNIESKYILSQATSTWPQNDSRFYWPDDFTMVSGAKISFKFLYWYKDGYEIKESGMVTRTIEF